MTTPPSPRGRLLDLPCNKVKDDHATEGCSTLSWLLQISSVAFSPAGASGCSCLIPICLISQIYGGGSSPPCNTGRAAHSLSWLCIKLLSTTPSPRFFFLQSFTVQVEPVFSGFLLFITILCLAPFLRLPESPEGPASSRSHSAASYASASKPQPGGGEAKDTLLRLTGSAWWHAPPQALCAEII